MKQQSIISTWAKKNFILWFMDNYPLRNGARRVLKYLAKRRPVLSSLHIIENGSLFRPLLVISSTNSGMPSCLLLTINKNLHNPDAILEYLENYGNNKLFLTFYFPDRRECRTFWRVLEEAILVIEPEKAKSLQFNFEIQLLLEEEKNETRRKQLLAEIDLVLGRGEKETFHRLVRELKKL